eukprot:2078811-Pleurochrysis_carterae.AAC.1
MRVGVIVWVKAGEALEEQVDARRAKARVQQMARWWVRGKAAHAAVAPACTFCTRGDSWPAACSTLRSSVASRSSPPPSLRPCRPAAGTSSRPGPR